ncbi:UNVERIFIED_CONTAM: zinc finger protein 45 [Trichonephila clavipes]
MCNLKAHVWTHTNEKPYVCAMCNKGFSQKGNLKDHLRTHTKEKPYICEMCNKSFSRTSSLKEHLRTHTNEKPYVCETCNKSFSQTRNNYASKRNLGYGSMRSIEKGKNNCIFSILMNCMGLEISKQGTSY